MSDRGGAARGGNSSASPVKGSRKARLRCTGPGPWGPRVDSANARAASGLHVRSWPSVGTPGETAHRVAVVKIPTWSIVCGAPVSWSSGGRSAVQTISGTRAWCASTTAA